MLKKFTSDYLSFTRKERTGIIAVLAVIILFMVLPFFYPLFIHRRANDHSAFEKDIASLTIKQADSSDREDNENNYRHYYPSQQKNYADRTIKGELFSFDPNTLSAEGWKKLGVREKTIATIQNYLSKGGKFRHPEDIGKIWGLHEDEVRRLLPYVSIVKQTAASTSDKKSFESGPYDKKENKSDNHRIISFDVNTADTSAFIALPGIGSKLASRIIAFRDKLGGFYKVEQVAETFALPDSVFQKIKISLKLIAPKVKQININTASVDEMKVHPYIRFTLANAIVQYRSQHGKFSSVADIKQIMIVTEELYGKLAAYITVQ